MKKLLIITVIILISILTIATIVKGIHLGNLSVAGLLEIKKESEDLQKQVDQATLLDKEEYKAKKDLLDTSVKKLQSEKVEYEDMVIVSTESDVQNAAQLKNYQMDFLWAKLGTHATNERVNLKLKLDRGSSGIQESYNVVFTVAGEYVGITDFITAIEDDSYLGFKIEEFRMLPGSENVLQATFVCKDIQIRNISNIPVQSATQGTGEKNVNATNGTNATNATNATNTQNNTNTVR